MNDIKAGEHDLLSVLRPDTLWGALVYLALFVLVAMALTGLLRRAVHVTLTRQGHIDRTTISFLQQFGTALVWVVILILYAHLIPVLRSLGTALLTGAGVASIVIGLAAQSTLGNLVAGISITIYKPFRLGDTLQVAAPTGAEVGVVELISLGYTTLRTPAGHLIVLPNALAASSATINLNPTFAPWPVTVTMRLARDVDRDAARRLALEVAAEAAHDPKAVVGCFLTKVESAAVAMELRLTARDAAARDALKSTLLGELARRFDAAKLGGGASESEKPTFS